MSEAEEDVTTSEEPTGLALNPLSTRKLGVMLLVAGVLGFFAAFDLSVERVRLLLDPSYTPTCSINPVLSCGSVMVTEQARLFGFPNPFIGIAAFAVLLVLGSLMVSRVRPPRWMMVGLQVGVSLGIVFIGWLVYQSVYVIGALCPYCMVVWSVMIPTFALVTADNLDRGVIPVPKVLKGVAGALADYRLLVACALGLVVMLAVLTRFWYYWSTLL
jgi:uncharacterized membrane protein